MFSVFIGPVFLKITLIAMNRELNECVLIISVNSFQYRKQKESPPNTRLGMFFRRKASSNALVCELVR